MKVRAVIKMNDEVPLGHSQASKSKPIGNNGVEDLAHPLHWALS